MKIRRLDGRICRVVVATPGNNPRYARKKIAQGDEVFLGCGEFFTYTALIHKMQTDDPVTCLACIDHEDKEPKLVLWIDQSTKPP